MNKKHVEFLGWRYIAFLNWLFYQHSKNLDSDFPVFALVKLDINLDGFYNTLNFCKNYCFENLNVRALFLYY